VTSAEQTGNPMSIQRAAVVTGGAGGIGRAVLHRLRGDGLHTVSWDLSNPTPAADTAFSVDVTDATALDDVARRTVDGCGPIVALVINAGILGPVGPVWEASPAEIRQVFEVNLTSAFLTVRSVVPHMRANPGPDRGRIVIMSSLQAKEGTALSGPYAASKAGLIALTKVLGKELAADGILVNAVAPTVVRTSMEQSITPKRRADLLSRIPLGRFMEPEEVAEMVAWLCSPKCSFSTGAVFDLSGGRATS
jgi:NAD(P)-dependent dehydrogenase (short-subunit alcohol dehydrogenase family)